MVTNFEEAIEVIRSHAIQCRKKPVLIRAIQTNKDMEIETLEGTMRAKKGDYIMEGVAKEIYPCKKEIFEESYEVVE